VREVDIDPHPCFDAAFRINVCEIGWLAWCISFLTLLGCFGEGEASRREEKERDQDGERESVFFLFLLKLAPLRRGSRSEGSPPQFLN